MSADTADAAVDLHFNMWRDLPISTDVLDVGIWFKKPNGNVILRIFIPAEVDAEQITDLSPTLQDNKTLAAVFNELWTVQGESAAGFDVNNENSERVFKVLRIPSSSLTCEAITQNGIREGTVVSVTSEFLAPAVLDCDAYIRLRVELSRGLSKLFGEDVTPGHGPLTGLFYKTRVVEFRVNEKRNYPDALKAKYPSIHPPRIRAIHFLLVTDIATEFVHSHASFRKMRRLESSLWTNYLSPLGVREPDNMIIYHWRARDDVDTSKSQEDFVAFCLFKKLNANVLWFLAAAVLVGTIGNALEGLLTNLAWGAGAICVQGFILLLAMATLGIIFSAFARTRNL